jgi:hypothetical protein
MIETAIHLFAGYQSQSTDDQSTLDNVSHVAAFVPLVEYALNNLQDYADNYSHEVGWNKVFHYEVTQEMGAWLYKNPTATREQFETQLLIVINQ